MVGGWWLVVLVVGGWWCWWLVGVSHPHIHSFLLDQKKLSVKERIEGIPGIKSSVKDGAIAALGESDFDLDERIDDINFKKIEQELARFLREKGFTSLANVIFGKRHNCLYIFF